MSERDGIGRWDRDGKPLALLEWERLHEDPGYRVVADTECGDELVRTMWEGLDDGVQVACMWMTGVRRADGHWSTAWRGYYPCTLAEAEEAHALVVALVKEAQE